MFSIQKLKKKKRHVFNSKTPSAKYGKKKYWNENESINQRKTKLLHYFRVSLWGLNQVLLNLSPCFVLFCLVTWLSHQIRGDSVVSNSNPVEQIRWI